MAVAGLRGRPAGMQYQVYTQMVLGAASAYGARLVRADSREVAEPGGPHGPNMIVRRRTARLVGLGPSPLMIRRVIDRSGRMEA